nr:glycosyltransferase [Microbacterium hydrocarbonoxydans]
MERAPLLDVEYVLPLRWESDDAIDELTEYLERLRDWVDVTVVDGSTSARFAAHAAAWSHLVRHIPCGGRGDAEWRNGMRGNGKVHGVLTGVAAARHERVVIADDDVRYDRSTLAAVAADLASSALVKPQNHFSPLPWHARWDTARSLLNRAVADDYPGTYAVRRSVLLGAGGYAADTLFENLEMERTVIAAGGRVCSRPDLYVVRRPPTARHFLSQRIRQAYDSWAQPARLAIEAAILPVVWSLRRSPRVLGVLVLAVILLAECGRRRRAGGSVFPPSSAFWAPLWVAERGVCSWIAIATRLRGGVDYGGERMRVAAHSARQIRHRIATTRHRHRNQPTPPDDSAPLPSGRSAVDGRKVHAREATAVRGR